MRSTTGLRPTEPRTSSVGRTAVPSWVVATGLCAASAYGFLGHDPYPGLEPATVTAAHAQDVLSVAVAGILAALAARPTAWAHLVRLGLFGYVAYSYFIYVYGTAMNHAFLVYVVLVATSGWALLDGVVRLDPAAWPRAPGRRLERGTGWFLVVVAVLFASLWLSTLVPFALGGGRPDPEGPGGAPFPVFVLDLTVVLPCLAAIGVLLVRGRRVGGPLAVVAVVKVITLFTVLWAGTVAGLVRGDDVTIGPDAGPSLAMLAVCCWLAVRWHRALARDDVVGDGTRPALWGE